RQRAVALARQPLEEARQARQYLDQTRMRRNLEQGPIHIDEQAGFPAEGRRCGHTEPTGASRSLCGAHTVPPLRIASGAMRKPEACQRYLQRGIDFGRPLTKLCGAVWIIC